MGDHDERSALTAANWLEDIGHKFAGLFGPDCGRFPSGNKRQWVVGQRRAMAKRWLFPAGKAVSPRRIF